MMYFVSARSDVGRSRENNEDNFSVNGRYMPQPAKDSYSIEAEFAQGVVAVCDGMGGESFGEFASLAGARTLADNYQSLLSDDFILRKKAVDHLIRSANSDICEEMQKKDARIGATIVLACLKDSHADVFNIGDSRAYLYRKGSLEQLTRDHTILQQKIDFGIITAQESANSEDKNRLTQHLGIFESDMVIGAAYAEAPLEPGDIILLCSDGLTDMVTNEEISAILAASLDVDAMSASLVSKALENGGKDNVTVVVVMAN